jgi:DNA-binding NtrC family response regulator
MQIHMRAEPRIWVIEQREALAHRIRSECPDFLVTTVRRERIILAPQAPHLAVVDATELAAACLSIREMRQRCPAVPVLLVASPAAAGSLPADIDDFVVLPFQPGELRLRLLRLSGLVAGRGDRPGSDELTREARAKCRLDAVIGESAPLLEAIRKVPRLGASEANVLITGETGTGKELFARAIHYSSARNERPFVPVNCGALPDTLFENELFGHEKGAYTDASTAGVGLLAVADRGSLFLDEVDSLSPASQAKLLRVMQDREYRPLGSHRSLRADVRIIAATNAPLAERLAAREFRPDLYYRLNVLTLRLPSLAERRDDIPILARHFIVRFARESGRQAPRLSSEAIRRLAEHDWPGNVRELESVIQRALVLSDGPALDAASIDLPGTASRKSIVSSADRSLTIADAVHEFERQYLASILSLHNGNISRAASAAGKDRRTFQRMLRRHGFRSLSAAAS